MKTFLITVAAFLVAAIVIVAAIFFYIQIKIANNPGTSQQPQTTTINETPSNADVQSGNTDAVDDSPSAQDLVPEEGVPLSDVPLSDSQKSVLEGAGVDTQNFVITKEMVQCGEDKIGKERMQELMNGAAPSFFETITLGSCL